MGRHGKDDYMCVYCCTDDLNCDATSVPVCACMPTTHPCNGTIHTATPPRTLPQTTPIHTHPHIRTYAGIGREEGREEGSLHKYICMYMHLRTYKRFYVLLYYSMPRPSHPPS